MNLLLSIKTDQYRLNYFWDLRTEAIFATSFNIFLFLTGILLVRKGAFVNDEAGRTIRKKMMKFGLLLGLPLNYCYLFQEVYLIFQYVMYLPRFCRLDIWE